jgi:transaldolase
MSLARCSSLAPRVRVARAPAARARASRAHVGVRARVPLRARSVAVAALDGEEVYEEDVDYSGNLCMFLDSASEEEWARWLPSGIFTGVTTNPIILERDNRACDVATLTELAKQALEYDAVQEFQVQTWGESSDEMWKNGVALASYDPDVIVVKVPGTFEGIKAANALVADGIRVTITAAYASHQAVLAAAVGANYVAPYLGRMNDAGRDGFGTVAEMQKTADKLDSDMRILVASVRNVGDIAKLAADGLRHLHGVRADRGGDVRRPAHRASRRRLRSRRRAHRRLRRRRGGEGEARRGDERGRGEGRSRGGGKPRGLEPRGLESRRTSVKWYRT